MKSQIRYRNWHNFGCRFDFDQRLFLKAIFLEGVPLNKIKKAYFTHYLCVVIILFNTGLYKFAGLLFLFGKLDFLLSVFSMVPSITYFEF